MAIVRAVDRGEISAGLIDHYYYYRTRDEIGASKIRARLHYFAPGDAGALVDVSGAAVLKSSKRADEGQRFLAYLVSKPAQEIIARSQSYEYPLGSGVQRARHPAFLAAPPAEDRRRGSRRRSQRAAHGRRRLAPNRRRVGYGPQEGALFPHLDARANVAFGLPRAERRGPRPDELLALVGLGGMGARRPHELSGGQQQRVALARALATKPDVVLLDEPFSALDPDLRTSMRAEVRATLARLGTTALLVTHDQEEALSCADLVAILRDGRISQAGSPRDLYLAPCDVEIARFLGDANILPARLAGDTAETRLGRLRLRSPLAGAAPRDGVVVLRPEDLRIAPAGGSGAANALVTAVEYFGHDARVALTCDHPAGEFALLARTRGIEAPHVGQRVVCRAGARAHAL